jgi:hypothetical protein
MKKYLKKSNLLILLAALVVIFSFYWFQIRPSNIRSFCANWALVRADADTLGVHDKYVSSGSTGPYQDFLNQYYKNNTMAFYHSIYDQDDYSTYYSRCIHENGI